MERINNLSFAYKFSIIIGIFGALALGLIIYSTGKMRQTDVAYNALLHHEGKAAVYLSRADRAMSRARAAIASLTIATTDAGNDKAAAVMKDARQNFIDLMAQANQASTAIASVVSELTPRGLIILDQTCAKTIKLGFDARVEARVAETEFLTNCEPVFKTFSNELNAESDRVVATQDRLSDELTEVMNSTIKVTYASVLGGIVLVVLGAFLAVRAWMSSPLQSLARTMRKLAAGDLCVVVTGAERQDEIGPMAQAVQVFKDNALKLKQATFDAAQAREAADQQRATNEAARSEVQRQQQAVVASIASGLNQMSNGNLTGRLNQPFAEEYEKLRSDYNATADSLCGAMSTIVTATGGISTGSDQIAHASDDLSRRTEQQAAGLEETAAALDLITATVKTMAGNASDAAMIVAATRGAAETSGVVVQQAMDAMGKIKKSSGQITNIIGVIDEIAFQTNLLALNAGVEAARAGEAGRGFAVVASEVRGLAQRSAEAAKEIKALISASSVQVEAGVNLVDETGEALKGIIIKVSEMDTLVRQISASSQEQATGLAEINTAVGQMDQIVQQNAAMVEESAAAAHALKSETQDLTSMVERFQIGGDIHARTAKSRGPVPARQAVLRSASRPVMKVAGSAAASVT